MSRKLSFSVCYYHCRFIALGLAMLLFFWYISSEFKTDEGQKEYKTWTSALQETVLQHIHSGSRSRRGRDNAFPNTPDPLLPDKAHRSSYKAGKREINRSAGKSIATSTCSLSHLSNVSTLISNSTQLLRQSGLQASDASSSSRPPDRPQAVSHSPGRIGENIAKRSLLDFHSQFSKLPNSSDPMFDGVTPRFKQSYDRGKRTWERFRELRASDDPVAMPCPDIDEWSTMENAEQADQWTDSAARFRSACDILHEVGVLRFAESEYERTFDPLNGLGFKNDRADEVCKALDWHTTWVYSRAGLPPRTRAYFQYRNFYSPQARTIIADTTVYNLTAMDVGIPFRDHPDFFRAPNPWCDVAFLSWSFLCSMSGIDPAALKFIADLLPKDPETFAVYHEVFRIYYSERRSLLRRPIVVEIMPTMPLFYAILGTPNAQRYAMLILNFAFDLVRDYSRTKGNRVLTRKVLRSVIVRWEPSHDKSFETVWLTDDMVVGDTELEFAM